MITQGTKYVMQILKYFLRKIAMLIREPELAYNTGNKRIPRGGRNVLREYNGSYNTGSIKPLRKKRAAEDEMDHYRDVVDKAFNTKAYWIEVLEGFHQDMTSLHSEMALFIYCISQ